MSQWWVSRSSSAVVILASPKTEGHSPKAEARILVLGITFKENVPDLRNSKAAELALGLIARGFDVTVHDPLADLRGPRRSTA